MQKARLYVIIAYSCHLACAEHPSGLWTTACCCFRQQQYLCINWHNLKSTAFCVQLHAAATWHEAQKH